MFSPLKPDWQHRDLFLPLGKRPWWAVWRKQPVFKFRTLSLYDLGCLWTHFRPIYDAIVRGKPIAFAQHLTEALNHLSPGLTNSAAFLKYWNASHLDALIEFYSQQDWGRIKALIDDMNESATEAPEGAGEMLATRRFVAVCTAAARSTGMDLMEFVSQRFEFCADVFMTLWASMQSDKSGSGQMKGGEFVALMHMGLPKETFSAPEDRPLPTWVKFLNEETLRLEKEKAEKKNRVQ
jgi:hypothetical protein